MAERHEGADWIAVDWGAEGFRAWAMSAGGEVLATAAGASGVTGPEAHEAALLSVATPWLGPGRTPVVICGDAGGRGGWAETPWRPVPCTPLAERTIPAPDGDPRLDVHLIPGIKQDNPADFMRGEETRIAGFLSRDPAFDGVVCLPGLHTKWAHVSAGEIVSFQTFLSGELAGLLVEHSSLRPSLAAMQDDADAFDTGVGDALSRPERLAAQLFALRAEEVLHDLHPAAARGRLAGLLIGAELAAARPYWLGQRVAILGQREAVRDYARALASQGVPAETHDAEDMTLAGLARVRATLRAAG